jgi:HNH endonuclease
MTYMLQNPDGQRYSAECLEDVATALRNGTVPEDSWAWCEGMVEWVPVKSLFPATSAKAKSVDPALRAAKAASGMLAKAGVGLAGFAAKSYRKATLQNRFSKALAAMLEDGRLEAEELEALRQMVAEAGGKWGDVIAECQPIAEMFIRHQLADAIADEEVTNEEEAEIMASVKLFGLEGGIKQEVKSTIQRVRLLANLHQNRLPAPLADSPAWLQSGEAVHAKQEAEFCSEGKIISKGDLWITNSRVEYIAPKGGASTPLKNIRDAQGKGQQLVLTNIKGRRDFLIPEAETTAAMILCLIRASNRTASVVTDETRQDRRRVSKEVRNAVWIRDGAACVECGSKIYLEFDHVIPVAKGGGNTVNNIQLLCRDCNGRKSDRI